MIKTNQHKKIIGITGGIGTGKTIVCKIFQALGIPVFNADETAKKLVETNQILKNEIIQLLGNEAYLGEKYNRKFVAGKVFNDTRLLQKLNGLIHPKVREAAIIWIEKQKNAPFYLYEAALMKAAGDANNFEKIILVHSPLALRIARIKTRDNRTEQQIMAIINKQVSDEERQQIADYTIENDEKNSIIEQVLKIHNELTNP
jgi:dephospho-CoA kinase